MLSPEDLSKMQLVRARILGQEQIPPEELRDMIRLLRANRESAAARGKATKAKSAARAKGPAQDAGMLLGGLGIKL
jgi:hypothetical protein